MSGYNERMDRVGDQLAELAPALAFLLAAVPLATLLDRLGFFRAAAARLTGPRGTSVLALWLLAAATTIVLNLDTTIVLLTPLYVRIARRADADPLVVALVPLLLASLASSVLPVSNLTNLVVAERVDLTTGSLLAHLGLPSLAAVDGRLVGLRPPAPDPTRRVGPAAITEAGDRRALRVGGAVVAAVLVGFVVGPVVGVAAVDDGARGRRRARRRDTTRAVARPPRAHRGRRRRDRCGGGAGRARPTRCTTCCTARPRWPWPASPALATVAANAVNNLPAVLVGSRAVHHTTWGLWAWLLGVNAGAVLLPLGALANLLWLRIVRTEGITIGPRAYARAVVPIALPALVAAIAVLVLERVVTG